MLRSAVFPMRLPIAAVMLALPLPAAACGGDAFQALKQLVGQWEVFRNDELAGELHMRPASGGCALLEEWQTVDGVSATGLHWPETLKDDNDRPMTVLHQIYVDSKGWFIHADGTFKDGALIYEGKTVEDGQPLVLRAVLHSVDADEILHTADLSTDGGETWERAFTLEYHRIR